MGTISVTVKYEIYMVINTIFKNKIAVIENMTDEYGYIIKRLLKSSNQFNDIIFVEIYRDDNSIERFMNIMNLIFRLSIYLETVIDVIYTRDKSYISSIIEKIIAILDDEYRFYWDR